MTDKVYNVLFICSHNCARSIMAEALLNHLGGDRFRAFSAGSHPAGVVHPNTMTTLEAMYVPAERLTGLRSKSWSEFAQPGAVDIDFVFTVCDTAAAETCPVWKGQPLTAHWGVADPLLATGPEAVQLKAFWEAGLTLKRRIDLMLALPIESLDTLTLRSSMRNIGNR